MYKRFIFLFCSKIQNYWNLTDNKVILKSNHKLSPGFLHKAALLRPTHCFFFFKTSNLFWNLKFNMHYICINLIWNASCHAVLKYNLFYSNNKLYITKQNSPKHSLDSYNWVLLIYYFQKIKWPIYFIQDFNNNILESIYLYQHM